jgi:transcriptional regulator with XRE-family HTH domain
MEKNKLINQFAERLRVSLIDGDYGSNRSAYGVNVNKFARMVGYSPQICRRYLRGEAIPEPNKLAEIAKELKVSPGWLLFGDCHTSNSDDENKITINKDLLHYIFTHANNLYSSENTQREMLPKFLLELINNVSQIKADHEQSKKIIDLALFSVKTFKPV